MDKLGWWTVCGAFLTSVVFTFGVLRSAVAGRVLIDVPNQRSSHGQPKPRGGGVGVVFGLLVGVAIASWGHDFHRPTLVLLSGALICAALGLWDDVRRLSVAPRLIVQTAVSTWLVFETGPLIRLPLPEPLDVPIGALGFVFPLFWLVGVMNFFNFMDGIDGLATGQAVAGSLLVIASSWSSDAPILAMALAGALLGFLPFNWWPSRIFLGDVGSLPVGFLLAGLPLLSPSPESPRAVLATAIGLSLFLLDPVVTLWRRWRRGAPLGQSHREHLYQQFLGAKDPHGPVALALVGAGLCLSFLGFAVYRWPAAGWAGVLVAASLFSLEYFLVRRRTTR